MSSTLSDRSHNAQSSGVKVAVDCQSMLNTTGSTLGWLDNIQKLETLIESKQHMSNKRIVKAILNKKESVVVKIAKYNEPLEDELKMARVLHEHKIPGILRYHCYFECDDDINNYPDSIPEHFCKTTGKTMKLLVMDYMKTPNFAYYEGTVGIFRSCLQQIVATLFEAYLSFKYVQGDTNLQNYLLEPSTKKYIEYPLLKIRVNVDSYETRMMDFEDSMINASDAISKFWGGLENIHSKLQNDYIWYIDIDSIRRIHMFMATNTNTNPTKEQYYDYCVIVKNITFTNRQTRNPQRSLVYRPFLGGGQRRHGISKR